MSAIRGAVVALALLAVAGCSSGSDLGEGPGPGALPTETPSTAVPTTTLPTPAVSTTPPGPAKIGGVTVGKYAEDPAVQAFASFVQERTTALRRRDTRYAPLIALTTRSRQAADREFIQRMIDNDEVFEGTPRYVVIGAATTGSGGRVRACQRDDSSWFLNRKTGKRSETKPIWTAHDVRMVRSEGTWKVDGVYAANFSCGEAR